MNSFVKYVFYLIVAWGRNWKTISVMWYFSPTGTLNQMRPMFCVNGRDDRLQRAFKTNRNNLLLLPVRMKTNNGNKTTTRAFPHYMIAVCWSTSIKVQSCIGEVIQTTRERRWWKTKGRGSSRPWGHLMCYHGWIKGRKKLEEKALRSSSDLRQVVIGVDYLSFGVWFKRRVEGNHPFQHFRRLKHKNAYQLLVDV